MYLTTAKHSLVSFNQALGRVLYSHLNPLVQASDVSVSNPPSCLGAFSGSQVPALTCEENSEDMWSRL